jgi:hypothetical protein
MDLKGTFPMKISFWNFRKDADPLPFSLLKSQMVRLSGFAPISISAGSAGPVK